MPYPIRPNVDPTPFVRQPGVQPTAGGVSPMPNIRPTPQGPPGVRDPMNPPQGNRPFNPMDWRDQNNPPPYTPNPDIPSWLQQGYHWDQQRQMWVEGSPQGMGLQGLNRPTHAAYGSQGGRPGFAPGPVGSASYGGGMSVGSGGGGGQQEQLAMLLQQLMGQGG